MTNLHLGGARGDLAAVRGASAGDRLGAGARDLRAGGGLLPRHALRGRRPAARVGWRRFAVGEVNAFGDLLPRLTGLPGSGAEDMDTYAAQVTAVPGSVSPGRARRPSARRTAEIPLPAAPFAVPPRTAHDPARTRPAPCAHGTPRPLRTDADGAPDMNAMVGSHDLLLVTLDTLRYDVAAELAAAGRHPASGPPSAGRRLGAAARARQLHLRRAPGVLRRVPAHPGRAGTAPAAVRGARSRAARRRPAAPASSTPPTWSPVSPARGYHTVCVGGVGFFNKQGAARGRCCRGCSRRATGSRSSAVTSPTSFEAQVARAERVGRRATARPAAVPVRQRVRPAPAQLVPPARRDSGDGRQPGHPRRRPGVRRPAHRPAVRRRCSRGAAASRSSAPTTAPPTARTATPGHRLGHEVRVDRALRPLLPGAGAA